jgi:hypothetical protein
LTERLASVDRTDGTAEQSVAETTRLSDAQIEARVEAWLPDDFDFRVATRREQGEWFALAVDFDVTGKGPTRSAAVRQMSDLLSIYLAAYLIDDASFMDTVRPVPARLRLRIQVESALGRALGGVIRHMDGGLSLVRESNYILPVSEVALHARC